MIGSSDNRVSYDGNGIATEFSYTFKILEKGDLEVLHVAADGTETLLTKDYYVDMEKSVVLYPGYAPGAEIPESERPPILPVGERLVLYREVPITQESALDKHWPFNVVENGLDKLTIICQQMWDRLTRSFYVSEATSTNFDTKIPIEAGKTFRVKDDGTGFEVTEDPGKVIDGATALLKQTTKQAEFAKEQADASSQSAVNAQNAAKEVKEIYGDGNFTPLSDLLGGLGTKLKRWGVIFANKVFASNLPIVYNSVAEMKADTMLWEGMSTKTLGYYAPNDGGGANYLIREKLESDIDDGGSIHELQNGLVAELVIENGTVNVKQFGAKGDGVSDDSNAIQTAIDSNNRVFIPIGVYKIQNSLTIPSYTYISGVNYGYGTKLIADGCDAFVIEGNRGIDLGYLTISSTDMAHNSIVLNRGTASNSVTRVFIHDIIGERGHCFITNSFINNTMLSNYATIWNVSIKNITIAGTVNVNYNYAIYLKGNNNFGVLFEQFVSGQNSVFIESTECTFNNCNFAFVDGTTFTLNTASVVASFDSCNFECDKHLTNDNAITLKCAKSHFNHCSFILSVDSGKRFIRLSNNATDIVFFQSKTYIKDTNGGTFFGTNELGTENACALKFVGDNQDLTQSIDFSKMGNYYASSVLKSQLSIPLIRNVVHINYLPDYCLFVKDNKVYIKIPTGQVYDMQGNEVVLS